jgi:hypothetical protein
MKSIQVKILVTIFVITVALCSSIARETTKSKTAAKTAVKTATKEYNGDGDFNTGYNCPYIQIKQSKTNAITKTGKWSFRPAKISEMMDGLELVMADGLNSEALREIVKSNAVGGATYIPWRFFETDEIQYEKITRSFKQIIFNVRTDNAQRYEVTLALPWAGIGSYITVEQVLSVMKSFQDKRDSARQTITALKNSISLATTTLKPALDNLLVKQQGEQKIIDDATRRIAEIKAALPALAASEKTIQDKIDAKLREVDDLEKNRAALQIESNTLSNEIERDTLLMDDSQRLKLTAEAADKIPRYQKLIDDQILIIKVIASDASSLLNAENAKKAAFAYNKAEMITNLNKIYSKQ